MKRQKTQTRQYVRAPGAPIGSDKDAEIIGRCLQQIADEHRVDNVRSLDKKLVFGIIESDPNHPMRRFYDWDERNAARAHWIERTGTLIRSVRVVVVSLPGREERRP